MTDSLSEPPLSTDLSCVRCGYNLRTRSPEERCPECGELVALSIRVHRLYGDTLRAPRGAAIGFRVLACALAFEAVAQIGMHFGRSVGILPLASNVLNYACEIAALVVLLIILAATRDLPSFSPLVRRLFKSSIFLVPALVAVSFGMVYLYADKVLESAFRLFAAFALQPIGWAALYILAAIHFSRLASALELCRLRTFFRVAFVLVSFAYLLNIAYILLFIAGMSAGRVHLAAMAQLFFLASIVLMPLTLVLAAGVCVRFASRLRRR